jgi:NAD(P)H dehydrogenase (quinone)
MEELEVGRPIRVLIVFAHQEPQSFNGAMRDTVVAEMTAQGHEVCVSDLYAEGFNPVAGRHDFLACKRSDFFKYQDEQINAVKTGGFASDIAREHDRLIWCDLVIFQCPLWWFSVPAILKGWFDRVLAYGFAYGGGRWFENGPLKPRRALLSMTAGAPNERYMEGAIFGDIARVIYPIHVGVFNLCGLAALEPAIVWAPTRIGPERRAVALANYAERVRGLAEERPLPMHSIADHPDPMAGNPAFIRA